MSGRAERVAAAEKLRARGLSVREIAERLGVGISTAATYLSDPRLEKQKARDRRHKEPARSDAAGAAPWLSQRREIVAEERRLACEAAPGQLHAVPGVAGEADDHLLQLLDGLAHLSNR